MQSVGQAAGEAVEAGLRRAIDVVGPPHTHPSDRGEGHDRARPAAPHPLGKSGEQRRLGNEVRVQYCRGRCGVGFGASLIAQHPESEHSDVHRPYALLDLGEHTRVIGDRVGIESHGLDADRSRRLARSHLIGQRPRSRSQDDARPGSEPLGDRETDLTASAEDDDVAAHSRPASLSILANVESRPSNSIDSNSGGETVDPVTAIRTGPKANFGLMPSPSTRAVRSVDWIAS